MNPLFNSQLCMPIPTKGLTIQISDWLFDLVSEFLQFLVDAVRMLGDFITRCLILLLGYAYPGFECYKTVEKNRVSFDELRFWCQYWIIVAFLTVAEKFTDVFIGWFPLYDELKLALFIYLWYPKTKGTRYVYDIFLKPYVSSHEHDIDKKFQEWRARAWDLAIFYWQNCTELGQGAFVQILDFLAGQSARFSNKSSSKKKKQEGPTAPSAPPLPSLRNALFENNQNNFSGKNPLIRRNISETPKSQTVQVYLDSQTEYLQEEAWAPEPVTIKDYHSSVRDTIKEARVTLRRLKHS